MDGNKKKIKMVKALYRLKIPIGELTIREDPVVTVTLSKIPAEAEAIKKANTKNMAA